MKDLKKEMGEQRRALVETDRKVRALAGKVEEANMIWKEGVAKRDERVEEVNLMLEKQYIKFLFLKTIQFQFF